MIIALAIKRYPSGVLRQSVHVVLYTRGGQWFLPGVPHWVEMKE